jgi:hypothetical protein
VSAYRKQIDVHVDGALIASALVDTARARFYLLKRTASPAIHAHGGAVVKVVDAGRVEYLCADGTLVAETITAQEA